jgi:hypothetical protein
MQSYSVAKSFDLRRSRVVRLTDRVWRIKSFAHEK